MISRSPVWGETPEWPVNGLLGPPIVLANKVVQWVHMQIGAIVGHQCFPTLLMYLVSGKPHCYKLHATLMLASHHTSVKPHIGFLAAFLLFEAVSSRLSSKLLCSSKAMSLAF